MSTARMQVLLISRKWPPAVGGMETYSWELSRELKKLPGLELHLRVLPGRKDGRPPHPISVAWFFATTAWHLFRNCGRYDVVHFGDMAQVGLASITRRWSPTTRTVVALHGLDVIYGRRSGLLPRIYDKYLRWARGRNSVDCYLANSRNTARLLKSQGFGTVAVIPLGVRMREQAEPQSIEAIGDKRFLLFFGRIMPRKGPRWFAEHVLPLLPPDISLTVVGTIWDADDGDYLRGHPRVHMPGAFPVDISKSEFEQLKRQAVAIVMPNTLNPDETDVEGFGLTALEAADNGAPLIAADIEGIRDAVRDGETGFRVPAENAAAWAGKIAELLGWSLEQRREFSAGAGRALRKYYSWARVARDTVAVYESNPDVDEKP